MYPECLKNFFGPMVFSKACPPCWEPAAQGGPSGGTVAATSLPSTGLTLAASSFTTLFRNVIQDFCLNRSPSDPQNELGGEGWSRGGRRVRSDVKHLLYSVDSLGLMDSQ